MTESNDNQNIPDIYFDRINVTTSLFGVNFTLSLSEPHPNVNDLSSPPKGKDLIIVRTGLQHAKVFAMLLKRQLKSFEEKVGEINLPDELYVDFGLNKEEW